jgi:hypothetical protein
MNWNKLACNGFAGSTVFMQPKNSDIVQFEWNMSEQGCQLGHRAGLLQKTKSIVALGCLSAHFPACVWSCIVYCTCCGAAQAVG